MPEERTITSEPADVEAQLTKLGVPADGLNGVLQATLGARQVITLFHPKASPGLALWSEGTAALRRLLVGRHKWEYDELGGQPRTVRPDGKMAIVVQGGDLNTGCEYGNPSTSNPKGKVTALCVSANAAQLSFFDVDMDLTDEAEEALGPMTWVLLMAIVGKHFRAELSLPDEISESGFVVSWKTRVILTPIPVDGDDLVISAEDDTPREANVAVALR